MTKLGKIGLTVGIVMITLPIGGEILLQTARLAFCRTDEAERVNLPGSPWRVITRIHNCGVPDPGSMKIVAENQESRETVVLFEVDAEAMSRTTLTSDGILELFPDDVQITQHASQFGRFKATFRQLSESSLRISN
jgi:hypothetical protein